MLDVKVSAGYEVADVRYLVVCQVKSSSKVGMVVKVVIVHTPFYDQTIQCI